MGQVYVQVDANTVNGIMTLDASGGGEEGGSYWIEWDNATGFTGTGWSLAWDSPYTPLKKNWTDHPADGFANTYEGFLSYVETASSLNDWLGDDWTNSAKKDFIDWAPDSLWSNCTRPA